MGTETELLQMKRVPWFFSLLDQPLLAPDVGAS